MNIFHDKFFILSVISCLILVSFCCLYEEDKESKDMITGIIIKTNESEKGFVFDIEITDGSTIHCFCKECPLLSQIYTIEGSYSDDGSIFFVSKLQYYGS